MMDPKESQPSSKVRVVIADDHQIVRVGLRALLDVHPQIAVVAEANNGAEALALARELRPEVMLIDMRMPGMDGIEICRRLKSEPPSPAVLFLTSYADEPTTLAAVEAGADGYLLKSFSGQDIPGAILTVAEGGFVMDPTLTGRALKKNPRSDSSAFESLNPSKDAHLAPFSLQERRVMDLVAQGCSNRQAAQQLGLSEGTVRNYLSNAVGKIGVSKRVHAILWWLENRSTPNAPSGSLTKNGPTGSEAPPARGTAAH